MPTKTPKPSITSSYLSRIRPLCALHGHGLRSGARVTLLGHPLAVAAEGTHTGPSGLVHAHRRATHVRTIHTGSHTRVHAPCHGRRATGPRLVHKLGVVALRRAHLKRGADLWKERRGK